jgi:dolichol-phosphate hexosyltransferase
VNPGHEPDRAGREGVPERGPVAVPTAVAVVVPAKDEAARIAATVRAASAIPGVDLVVVVDDGSRDDTATVARAAGADITRHERNRGKGAAIATALDHARGTYATIMDADLEYDPRNIGPLLEPLLRGDAEAVYGVRGFDARSAYSFWYVAGNKLVTLATNVLFDVWLSDIMTCQKVLPTALFRALPLRETGFAVEAEITARLLGAGVRIYEVPVSYRARSREEGKKLRASDGVRVLGTLLRCRLDRRGIGDRSRYVPDPSRRRVP